MLVEFLLKAVPIFLGITVLASLLNYLGVISALAGALAPATRAFHLPVESVLPVVLASIRKDGILLFAQERTLAGMTPGQLLTGVYLAGVLLPCLVTVLTIAREQSLSVALKLVLRQALAASVFACALGWGSHLFGW